LQWGRVGGRALDQGGVILLQGPLQGQ
jgi:hypothetical protein